MSDIQNSIYVSGSYLQYWYRFSWVCRLRAWSLSNGKRLKSALRSPAHRLPVAVASTDLNPILQACDGFFRHLWRVHH
jgi:hypothetical protein